MSSGCSLAIPLATETYIEFVHCPLEIVTTLLQHSCVRLGEKIGGDLVASALGGDDGLNLLHFFQDYFQLTALFLSRQSGWYDPPTHLRSCSTLSLRSEGSGVVIVGLLVLLSFTSMTMTNSNRRRRPLISSQRSWLLLTA